MLKAQGSQQRTFWKEQSFFCVVFFKPCKSKNKRKMFWCFVLDSTYLSESSQISKPGSLHSQKGHTEKTLISKIKCGTKEFV